MPAPIPQTVIATSIAFSFILIGNAITQSFMTIPALLVDFPKPGESGHSARATLLGRQWPLCWTVGNNFFRPMSTLGIFGYAFTAWAASRGDGRIAGDWRLFALSAVCHLINVVHSAVNMQPINDKLESLNSKGAEQDRAEEFARRWARGNMLRIVFPAIAGANALYQLLF